MGLLSLVFGETGKFAEILGGLTYVIAFFIFVFFILMLLSQRVSGENMVLFTLVFLLLIIAFGLWTIPTTYIIIPVVFIVLFIGNYVWVGFNKQ